MVSVERITDCRQVPCFIMTYKIQLQKRQLYIYLYFLFECFEKWVSMIWSGWGWDKEGCDLVARFDALRMVRILRYYKQLLLKFSYLSCKSQQATCFQYCFYIVVAAYSSQTCYLFAVFRVRETREVAGLPRIRPLPWQRRRYKSQPTIILSLHKVNNVQKSLFSIIRTTHTIYWFTLHVFISFSLRG